MLQLSAFHKPFLENLRKLLDRLKSDVFLRKQYAFALVNHCSRDHVNINSIILKVNATGNRLDLKQIKAPSIFK